MKKAVIALSILGISVLFYFLCADSDDKEETAPLLSNTMSESSERSADGGTEVSRDEEGGEAKRDSGGDESRQAVEDTASFMIQGDPKEYTYKAINSFKKISMNQDYTGHVANFAGNMASINTSSQDTYNNVISIMLPPDAVPGAYNEKSSQFMFQFFGSENGKLFTVDVNYPFTVNLTDWDGPGGRARGSFSGQLMANDTGDVITIQGGRFDVGIQKD